MTRRREPGIYERKLHNTAIYFKKIGSTLCDAVYRDMDHRILDQTDQNRVKSVRLRINPFVIVSLANEKLTGSKFDAYCELFKANMDNLREKLERRFGKEGYYLDVSLNIILGDTLYEAYEKQERVKRIVDTWKKDNYSDQSRLRKIESEGDRFAIKVIVKNMSEDTESPEYNLGIEACNSLLAEDEEFKRLFDKTVRDVRNGRPVEEKYTYLKTECGHINTVDNRYQGSLIIVMSDDQEHSLLFPSYYGYPAKALNFALGYFKNKLDLQFDYVGYKITEKYIYAPLYVPVGPDTASQVKVWTEKAEQLRVWTEQAEKLRVWAEQAEKLIVWTEQAKQLGVLTEKVEQLKRCCEKLLDFLLKSGINFPHECVEGKNSRLTPSSTGSASSERKSSKAFSRERTASWPNTCRSSHFSTYSHQGLPSQENFSSLLRQPG